MAERTVTEIEEHPFAYAGEVECLKNDMAAFVSMALDESRSPDDRKQAIEFLVQRSLRLGALVALPQAAQVAAEYGGNDSDRYDPSVLPSIPAGAFTDKYGTESLVDAILSLSERPPLRAERPPLKSKSKAK